MKNRLKKLRQEKGLSQKALTEMLNDKFGFTVSLRTVQNWEANRTPIKSAPAQILAEYFEVSLGYLLGYDKEINSALYETLPTLTQKTDEQYEYYLKIYKNSVIEANNQLDNVVKALNPEQFSFDKISGCLIALAEEITKLETSSEALLKLKDMQIQNITMKHELERSQSFFDNN